jgi:Fe-S-cluster containining protein
MISPAEVARIAAGTGNCWDAIAVPYPEFIEGARKIRFTLGWCLRCQDGRCTFLQGKECSVYADRPWICRTYPFMLEDDELRVSGCTGIGQPMTVIEAEVLARDLVARREAETAEELMLRRILADLPPLEEGAYVIDSRGVRPCGV